MSARRLLVTIALLLAGLLVAGGRALERWAHEAPQAGAPASGPAAGGAASTRPESPADERAAPPRSESGGGGAVGLEGLDDPRLTRQVRAVVESMDRTGRPPQGVWQGGRKGGPRGIFDNAEGRLPAQPRGHYTETDVWPRGPAGRGAERLVFGRDGEVYYSRDHYRSFVRVR